MTGAARRGPGGRASRDLLRQIDPATGPAAAGRPTGESMPDTQVRIRTDFKASTSAMARSIAYHDSEADSKSALSRVGPGDTYAETWTRDDESSPWRLDNVQHLGHTERTAA